MNYRKLMEAEPDQETLRRHIFLLFGTTDFDNIDDNDLKIYWKIIRPRLLASENE